MNVEKEIERLRNEINELRQAARAMPGGMQVLGNVQRVMGGTEYDGGIFIPLGYDANHPILTSASFNLSAFSTVATRTQIDLSASFGAPDGIRAIAVHLWARDDASAATAGAGISLASGSSGTRNALVCSPAGLPNNYMAHASGIVPCDANGDVWYTCAASGAGTLDVAMEIWGYWL